MLVLKRMVGESILIGDDIVVTVVRHTKSEQIRLGVTAPRNVRVDRLELPSATERFECRQRKNAEAAHA
jgi:carbon storage regulator